MTSDFVRMLKISPLTRARLYSQTKKNWQIKTKGLLKCPVLKTLEKGETRRMRKRMRLPCKSGKLIFYRNAGAELLSRVLFTAPVIILLLLYYFTPSVHQ